MALGVGVARREGLVPPSVRWVAALLPVVPMVGYFFGLGQWLRKVDELEALPNTPIGDSWAGLWVVLFFSWFLGQLLVRRKYR